MAASPSLHPAPAIVVRADLPISDCVRLMREKNIGSVLVVSDLDENPDLIGIFTERDLVQRVELIEAGGHWKRPIRTIMTKPVKTLDVADLDQAGEFLLRNGFRHAPVTIREGRKLRLLGMVSMRDLFRSLWLARETGAPVKEDAVALTLFSSDAGFRALIEAGLKAFRPIEVDRLELKRVVSFGSRRGRRSFLLDVDGVPAREWATFLRELAAHDDAPFTVVVLDPLRHAPEAIVAMKKLRDTKRFAVMEKPVSIPLLFQLLAQVVQPKR